MRLYNLLLLFCNKVHLIDYKIDHKKYLDKLTKEHNIGFETNEISKNALNRFISNINQNPINPATQLFINKELNRTFFNRKKIAEYINKYPDTKNIDVSRPIFIVGLPRTGTTALQNMFSVLDDCRVLNLWELHYPTSYSEGVKAINNANKSLITVPIGTGEIINTNFCKIFLNQNKNIFTPLGLITQTNVLDYYLTLLLQLQSHLHWG